MGRPHVALALVHHPVLDRRGDTVTTAVTNLDLHDIARTAKTYGVDRYYVVTPVEEQQNLVGRILDHWLHGHGATYNPHRGEALSLVKVVATLEEALRDWEGEIGSPPMPLLTGAARTDGITYAECRRRLKETPILLVFGTGWGLTPELFHHGWLVLEPVKGDGSYNHLPVRSAVAIILDRLLARRGVLQDYRTSGLSPRRYRQRLNKQNESS